MTATRTCKTLAELDLMLDRLAVDPDGFSAKAKRRAQDWNRKDYDLELRDPSTWKDTDAKQNPDREGRVASIEEQLRTEIDTITIMGREEEAQHARRIEFARLRLEHSLKRHKLSEEDISGRALYSPTTYRSVCEESCELPSEVCRRWVELHHLRTELVERNLYLAVINLSLIHI